MGSNVIEQSVPASHLQQEIERLLGQFEGKFEEGGSDSSSIPLRSAAIFEIFNRCGLPAREDIHLLGEARLEADGEFEALVQGVAQRFVLELKFSARLDPVRRAIEVARRNRNAGRYDRALVVVAGKIPEAIRREAEGMLPGYLDLLGIPELRSWLWKNAPMFQPSSAEEPTTCSQIIREAMRAIAERLARAPAEILTIEWRDLERVLREVFEGMGFETTLTRSSRDGGFDLALNVDGPAGRETYLIEVKHWTDQKPGKTHIRKLVRVTAREKASRGILLSSSGFSPRIYEGLTEAERKTVAAGARDKIIGLCKTYYRLGHQLWMPEQSITERLLDGLT